MQVNRLEKLAAGKLLRKLVQGTQKLLPALAALRSQGQGEMESKEIIEIREDGLWCLSTKLT